MTDNKPSNLNTSPWDSLERAKFSLSVLQFLVSTAIAVGLFFVSNSIDQAKARRQDQQNAIDRERSRLEKIDDKKIELWDKMGPHLNEILQYITYVGDWKHITAKQVIKDKRDADELFYTYRPFFSGEFIRAYGEYMEANFQMFNDMGEDAKIKTSEYMRPAPDAGNFADDYDLDRSYAAYNQLLEEAGRDFHLPNLALRRPSAPVSAQGSNQSSKNDYPHGHEQR